MIAAQTNGADWPFGLDVDDHVIAWTTSQSCVSSTGGGNSHCEVSDCTIAIYAMPEGRLVHRAQGRK